MKKALISLLWGFIFSIFILLPAMEVKAGDFYYPPDDDGRLIVVLDPGHGGSNLGADYNGFVEKEMNLVVAKAMAEELRKYEGITVYLTHEDADTEMSLAERAEFAANVNADFLFCLHFNMSPGNILYGSEVWISAFGEENRQGYSFAALQLNEMKNLGLSIRGIKTRLNDKGTDYYGILRECTNNGIPAALIEHCHIDHDADVGFCDSTEDLIALGQADADAVAKFFRLHSDSLMVDYSNFEDTVKVSPDMLYAGMDTTDPDICIIEEAYADVSAGKIGVQVTGCDYDSPMQYYAYSLDGGETYTPYLLWPDADLIAGTSPDTFLLEIDVPVGMSPSVIVKAVNQYDRFTESNLLTGFPVFMEEDIVMAGETDVNDTDVSEGNFKWKDEISPDPDGGFRAPEKKETNADDTFAIFLKICLFGVLGIFLLILLLSGVWSRRHHGKRRKRKK